MKTQSKTSTRYSEACKMQIAEEISSGKFPGAGAASRAYGMKGSQTVRNWILKYGGCDLLPKKIAISSVEEDSERKRVKDLEKALADSSMKGLLERGLSGSMAEQNHCYENCHAERVSGTLMSEDNLDLTYPTKLIARAAIDQAMLMYNNLARTTEPYS